MDSCNNLPKIGIIGAGFSGLCAAIQLQKQLGIDNYILFDENNDVGGTWHVNTYPGCACDIPSHMYSFSFEPNPYWSKAYSPQQEIWEYMKGVARKHDLYRKIKFHHKVTSAEWDEKISKWHVTVLDSQSGEESHHVFDILVSGIGALRAPNSPEQFEPFSGPKMHSAQWDHSIDIKNKVVAIVGSGASAVQIIPSIVDKVKRLIVYQRHAAWVVPRIQCVFPSYVQWTFANVPGVQWALRNAVFWFAEWYRSAFKVNSLMSKLALKRGMFQLNRQIEDPELRKKLTPTYSIGCKRITPSNDYYPALCKKNVTLITSKITEVTDDTIINEDGTHEKPDVLILATGFKVQEYFSPLKITAKGGEDLMSRWKKLGPTAFAGIASHLTPNCFFLLGPNTGLGHNSVIFMIECQVNWMIETIKEMSKRGAKTVAMKKSAEDEYMKFLLNSMSSTVWASNECGSWYADHRGIITALWPESLLSYYNLTKTVDVDKLDFS